MGVPKGEASLRCNSARSFVSRSHLALEKESNRYHQPNVPTADLQGGAHQCLALVISFSIVFYILKCFRHKNQE